MSNPVPIEIEPVCQQCGAKLLIKHSGTEPEPEDRVLCPVHGDVGSLQEVRTAVYEQNREKIQEQIAKHVRDSFRKLGR